MRSLLFCVCWLRNVAQCQAFANANRTAGLLNLNTLGYRALHGAQEQLKLLTVTRLCTHSTNTPSPTSAPNTTEACGCVILFMRQHAEPQAASFRTKNNWSIVSVNERFFDSNHQITSIQQLISSSVSVFLFKCAFSFGLHIYTECPGGNVPDFGRMFLTLKYTDITQNTYIRS